MQRWHQASCSKPDVEVLNDGTPHCRTCNEVPQIDELVADRATTSSVPLVPPDKPMGRMNLWWPPSVPYTVETKQDTSAQADGTQASQVLGSASEPSLYTSTLQSNEFRLICLSPVDDYEYPLHLELEVYDLENCPEYETVSYTWAGEDGDGSLCQPIYIGPFWDVLLQTKNCWEMLRFIRPWRGTRMVWVDAVCINQKDILERNSQVANMGRIYSTCTRAIVYLGPDIAVPLHKKHPRRRRLHELESGAIKPIFPSESTADPDAPPIKLIDLLKRRYFTRVWVVQELLLSQRVIMRVGDVDFWADPATSTYFSTLPEWNWDRTFAAWVQYISQGTSRVKDLRELLWLTAASRATDPRDRVFGLLGIMPELSRVRPVRAKTRKLRGAALGGLQPDYTLSCQHVFIGLFAYCLINMQQPNILYHASCLSANMANFPTWAPNWTTPTTWRLLFQSPKITSNEVFSQLQDLVEETDAPLLTSRKVFELYELKGPGQPTVVSERAWHQNVSIDSSSGALNINLTHYMAIPKAPEKIGRISGFHVFALHAEPFSVYLLTEQRLDMIIKGSGDEHLYALNVDDHSIIYLLLTKTYNANYKLICICPFVMIKIPSLRSINEIPNLRTLPLKGLQNSLYDAKRYLQSRLEEDIYGMDIVSRRLFGLFPGVLRYADIFPLVIRDHQGQHEGRAKHAQAFAAAYEACIDAQFQPRVEGSYVMITLSSAPEHAALWETYTQESRWERRLPRLQNHPWEYRVFDTTTWTASATAYVKRPRGERLASLTVRFPVAAVHEELNDSLHGQTLNLNKNMDSLWRTAEQTGEDYWDMLMRELRHEDQFVGCADDRYLETYWYLHIWEKLGMSGSTYQVTIE